MTTARDTAKFCPGCILAVGCMPLLDGGLEVATHALIIFNTHCKGTTLPFCPVNDSALSRIS